MNRNTIFRLCSNQYYDLCLVSTMRMPATMVAMTASEMPLEQITLTSSFSDMSSLSSTAATFVTRSATFDVEISSGQNGRMFGVENRTTFVNTADVISSSVTSRSHLTSLDGYDVFLTSWPPVPGNMTSSKPQQGKWNFYDWTLVVACSRICPNWSLQSCDQVTACAILSGHIQ
jgi:hypothetical protein